MRLVRLQKEEDKYHPISWYKNMGQKLYICYIELILTFGF